MAIERTLSIIKPDATEKNIIGKILTRFEDAGLKVVATKKIKLDDELAGGFYAEHKERPFFGDLVSFMTSGPVVVSVLEGEDAVAKNRDLMGATNPKEAEAGTIRADFCESIDANGVHGSDLSLIHISEPTRRLLKKPSDEGFFVSWCLITCFSQRPIVAKASGTVQPSASVFANFQSGGCHQGNLRI